jgi:light-regulated signal transduction histidine kinase (bacteriophytochrome)
MALPLPFADCEREDLARLGLVQPRGGVALLDAGLTRILAASAGLEDLLGSQAALGPGAPARRLPARLRAALAGFLAGDAATAALEAPGAELECQAHRGADGVLLEWLRPTERPLEGVLAAAAEAAAEHAAMQLATGAPNAFAAAQLLAEAVARVSGYDRVMVYRFHPDWSGEVIAERRRPDMPPYLGLRYPASDIPAQARALYRTQLLRVVADVQDVPLPLRHAGAAAPDLAPALLRALAPVHVQYLKNMGVRATLTVSLLHRGQLWGLLALHHDTPRLPARQLRNAVLDLAAPFEALLGRVEAAAASRCQRVLQGFRRDMANGAPEDLLARMLLSAEGLAGAAGADGVAWIDAARVIAVGLAPDAATLRRLAAQAPCSVERLDLPPPANPRRVQPAGMLARRLPGGGCLALFRRELVQELHWGGNPAKAAEAGPDGRLSPRRSFELWRQEVRGTCRPWEEEQHALLAEAATLLAASPDAALAMRAATRAAAMLDDDRRDGARSLADALMPHATAVLVSGAMPEARVLDVTPALALLLGVSAAALRGLPWAEAEPLLGLARGAAPRRGNPADPAVQATHSPIYGPLALRLRLEPLLQVAMEQGERRCDVLLVEDETRQGRLSEALRSAELQVERTRRAREGFLRTASHELRTPLAAIMGLSELISTPDAEVSMTEMRRYAAEIGRASRSMLGLVENLLSVARLEAGRFEAHKELLDLSALLREQASLLNALFRAKSIALRLDLPEAVPFATDASLLGPAVLNLLANALKFTPPGGEVGIALSRAAGAAEIAISDSGPGIAPADRARIFEAFEQAEHAGPRPASGAGLGLFIARRMVDALGGDLFVRPAEPRGSCFVVQLPEEAAR